tara:strand:+ start:804 stop:1031 length:228 start_codon:yes stop_codon:yes gene_type:complete
MLAEVLAVHMVKAERLDLLQVAEELAVKVAHPLYLKELVVTVLLTLEEAVAVLVQVQEVQLHLHLAEELAVQVSL